MKHLQTTHSLLWHTLAVAVSTEWTRQLYLLGVANSFYWANLSLDKYNMETLQYVNGTLQYTIPCNIFKDTNKIYV